MIASLERKKTRRVSTKILFSLSGQQISWIYLSTSQLSKDHVLLFQFRLS